jgi:hypothetical protein
MHFFRRLPHLPRVQKIAVIDYEYIAKVVN